MSPARNPRAFTLVELLIVVSIIAVLAVIALPNYLEAQTRSKTSRARSDLRAIATALEAYAADHNSYPPSGPLLPSRMRRLRPLTSPVSYLSALPHDPFDSADAHGTGRWSSGLYDYRATPIDKPSTWALSSDGPDRVDSITMFFGFPFPSELFEPEAHSDFVNIFYDPTNGTISAGDIIRAKDFASP